ncbi:hypothetical protein ACFVTC_41335 [Streptomyces sp. NPDC057950]|uniref:hypothetical protein n=1 Tax=Streptomyces sp. NPDC057950 TaxID=3346288 RepID=UPI0036E07566
MVEAVRERLRAGVVPAVVCGEFAVWTPRWSEAAVVVGLALGIAESELVRRLHGEPEQVQGQFCSGEELLYGELLETLGVFDVPKQLNEREAQVAEHLRTTISAAGGVSSGVGLGLSRQFVRGELTEAFRTLTRMGPRASGGRPVEFWAALVAAGEVLDLANDGRRTTFHALGECRRRLDAAIRSIDPGA